MQMVVYLDQRHVAAAMLRYLLQRAWIETIALWLAFWYDHMAI